MFTFDNSLQKEHIAKIGFTYLFLSIFCVLFSAVYGHFSHEVYSAYIIYAFEFLLVGGAVPFISMVGFRCPILPGKIALNLYNAGIETVTVGSVMAFPPLFVAPQK